MGERMADARAGGDTSGDFVESAADLGGAALSDGAALGRAASPLSGAALAASGATAVMLARSAELKLALGGASRRLSLARGLAKRT
jgi:hypothetical protein